MNQVKHPVLIAGREDGLIKIECPVGLFPVWGYYEKSCYGYTCTVLFVDIVFSFI